MLSTVVLWVLDSISPILYWAKEVNFWGNSLNMHRLSKHFVVMNKSRFYSTILRHSAKIPYPKNISIDHGSYSSDQKVLHHRWAVYLLSPMANKVKRSINSCAILFGRYWSKSHEIAHVWNLPFSISGVYSRAFCFALLTQNMTK